MLQIRFVLPIALFSASVLAQAPGNTPVDAKDLHLLKQTQPEYPAIARAAHVGGEVKLQVEIGADGHVRSSKVLSGPAMLSGAAQECVQEWVYEPVLDAAGTAAPATTVVSVPFKLDSPGHRADEAIAQRFFPLQRRCVEAVSSKESPAHQAESCTKAAQAAEAFDPGERFPERRSAFVYASTALLRDQQTQPALEYANKAVLVAEQGHDEGAGASAAYSVRAQAEAVGGNLEKALEDLSQAEQCERNAISRTSAGGADLVKREYVPTLKYILDLEVRVLTALGRTKDAAAKTSEATKM